MDLQSLEHVGDVTQEKFGELFESKLGALFPRALQVFRALGQLHSFNVANVFHLGLQKGIEKIVLEQLEQWVEVVAEAPDEMTAYVDTREMFDILYAQDFIIPGDSIGGLGPFEETTVGGNKFFVMSPRRST